MITNHTLYIGDHTECGPDCTITGDLCCGGHAHGVCKDCDRIREVAPILLEALESIVRKLNRKVSPNGYGTDCKWAQIDISDAVIQQAIKVIALAKGEL